MDRVIEIQVNGNYLIMDSHNAGTQGEANATFLRLQFDPSWEGLSKTIIWWNARGEDPTPVLLAPDLLKETGGGGSTYLVPIPPEPLAVPGKCIFAIDGYIENRRQRSVYGQLVVKAGGPDQSGDLQGPTPSQAEQLQSQIDALRELIEHLGGSGGGSEGDNTAYQQLQNQIDGLQNQLDNLKGDLDTDVMGYVEGKLAEVRAYVQQELNDALGDCSAALAELDQVIGGETA